MSAKKEATENVATEAAEVAAQKFTLEQLRAHCFEIFGISVSTFDGAISGVTGEHTIEEIKALIEKWGKKEVN